jgi:outer membrane immunogenic protein
MNVCKGIAFALLATVSVPTLSHAADLAPVRPMYVKAAPMIAPAFSWQGFYIGAHGGYGWGKEKDDQSSIFVCTTGDEVLCPNPGDKFDLDGFVAGGHIGYNWQSGVYVFGIEADGDATGLKGSTNFEYGVDSPVYTGTLSFKSQWQSSLRLRAGYAIDTTLWYLTGGVAFAGGKFTELLFVDDGPGSSVTNKHVHVGWTIGGGVEHAFTPNWIGRLEARYTDFGKKNYAVNPDQENDGPESVNVSWTQTVVTGGISYKF